MRIIVLNMRQTYLESKITIKISPHKYHCIVATPITSEDTGVRLN
jgi:hypothetical protein